MADPVPLLALRGLKVCYPTAAGEVRAVGGVDLDVRRGERVGIVGESGSGKSQLLLAVIGLLGAGAVTQGSVQLEGQELLNQSERKLDEVRGARIGMVFQDPMTALNPYLRVGTQLTEVLLRHRGTRRTAANELAVNMLRRLGIPDAAQRVRRFPHEFSGGMRQRVMIAIALLAEPAVLLADEPTTALDVTVQAQILDLLRETTRTLGTALVLVTHDLGVVARVCERVVVMFGGRVMESGPADAMFAAPRHPYTRALLASTPRIDAPPGTAMSTIADASPIGHAATVGCPFAPRCPQASEVCCTQMPMTQIDTASSLACHHAVLRGY